MSYNLYHNLPDLARKGGFMLSDAGGDEQDGSIDWRFIASIDTSRIIKECDFEKLDQCIPFLIRSSVGNLLNVRILDPAIARIYILSQLCLQYLLFCTKFLDKSVYSLRENIFSSQKKTVQFEEIIEKRDAEIEQLQKKLKRQENLNQPIFPCDKCTKNFMSAALLENHIRRKHPTLQESKDKDSNLINTIKLELEIKQLKERLNTTEKELMDASRKVECQQCQLNARRKFQSVAVQSNFEEKEKDDIEKDAIAELLSNQMKNFEELKQIEETRNRSEIIELRSKLDETIAMLRSQKETNVPSPAPRLVRIADKTVGTSSSIESLVERPKPEENLWKDRYEEMEKFYKEKMAATVNGIERSYNEKMSEIETKMKEIELERLKAHEQLAQPKLEQKTAVKPPLSPKVVKRVVVESSSSDNSIDSDDAIEAVRPLVVQEPTKPDFDQVAKQSVALQTFSAQKFNIRPKSSKPMKAPPAKADNREKAENAFFKRLKVFGILQDQKQLSKAEFNRVQSELVDNRDAVKKKRKSFFKMRREVISNLDKAYQIQESLKNETQNKVVNESMPSLKSYSKSSPQAKAESRRKEEVDYEVPTTTKKAFRDDLEKTLAKRLPASSLVTVQPTRDTEVTTKRKDRKVEFNLSPNFNELKEVAEDDSDFDVSSFTDFEEIR